ncbi:hypothetical protein M407DRAFT_22358 [Tulasnella calospora MUT 4182]|uniref:Uncharacterized protein n=1 Tax=Tulasnella calospora MUT 4182 TaxID=1051891 RepID=A0A0C3L3Y4_9AGAM|nr:hypothetical protein M407DRAFT_22358 [Tulasnella calospora MUT 4182]
MCNIDNLLLESNEFKTTGEELVPQCIKRKVSICIRTLLPLTTHASAHQSLVQFDILHTKES